MRKQFKQTVMDLALTDDRITMVFGDVSVYLFNDFVQKYPARFFNMGICENTLISAAGGLSACGLVPFVHTIAPFITERSYEQIKLDLCYNRFGANIVSCGASFDYSWDGATHHAYTDLAILRMLPNMEVMQPGSRKEADLLMRSQYANGKPSYFRLSDHPHSVDLPVEFGKGVCVQDKGAKVTVMTAGPILSNVLPAVSDLDVNLVYFHTIKPIDHDLVSRFRDTTVVVVHDAYGLAEAIHEVPGMKLHTHGYNGTFCCSYGTIDDARACMGLDTATIRKTVREIAQI
jgi:transketolase